MPGYRFSSLIRAFPYKEKIEDVPIWENTGLRKTILCHILRSNFLSNTFNTSVSSSIKLYYLYNKVC